MASLSQIELLLPDLRAYSLSICQSASDAEDLVHDAIERALRSANRPIRLDDLRPWMFRVMRNLSIDELRKVRVRREYSRAQERLSHGMTHHNDVARDTLLRLAYEKLPPSTREILFLVDIMGMKYDETAQVLDIPKGTVMSRISRARRALVELVDGSAVADAQRKTR